MGNTGMTRLRRDVLLWLICLFIAVSINATVLLPTGEKTLPIADPGEIFYRQFSYVEQTPTYAYRWSLPDATVSIPAPMNGWHIVSIHLANLFPLDSSVQTMTTLHTGDTQVRIELAATQNRHVALLAAPVPLWQGDWHIALSTAGIRYGYGTRSLGIAVRAAAFTPTRLGVWANPVSLVWVLLSAGQLWLMLTALGVRRRRLVLTLATTVALTVCSTLLDPYLLPVVYLWGALWVAVGGAGLMLLIILDIAPRPTIGRVALLLGLCVAVTPLLLRLIAIYGVPMPATAGWLRGPWSVLPLLLSGVCMGLLALHRQNGEKPSMRMFNRWGAVLLIGAIVVRTVQTAWINDDAQITLRTVMHTLHGNGLTFNVAERVQAYTHTVWFMLLVVSSRVTGNIYVATFVLSIVCSVCTVVLMVVRIAPRRWGIWVGLSALLLSKAYIDYSTSGLENPFTHLLIVILVILGDAIVFRGSHRLMRWFVLVLGLVFLNRPDAVVLLAPFAGYVLWTLRSDPRQLARALVVGMVPVLLWVLFSLWYYGFPLPNTAYAKVGSGIGQLALLGQAVHYANQTLRHDPVTLVVILLTLGLSLRARWYERSLALGITAYLASVALVGGDFMEGRFFAAPLLVAVIILSRCVLPNRIAVGLLVLVAGVGSVGFVAPLRASNDDIVAGIADERGYYATRFGLFDADVHTFQQPDWSLASPRFVTLCGGVGRTGLFYGPSLHILDSCALTDPLLSKLPAKYDPAWRIGHFYRVIPTMYFDSIMRDTNTLSDPSIHRYYDAIRTVTRGSLWDRARMVTILQLNLGLIPRPAEGIYRTLCVPHTTALWHIPEAWVRNPVYGGRRGTAGNIVFGDAVVIDLPKPTVLTSIDLSVNTDDVYDIEAHTMTGTRVLVRIDHGVAAVHYGPQHAVAVVKRESTGVMARFTLTVMQPMTAAHGLLVRGSGGDGRYAIGHLVVNH
jgi:arabinofuranosyltransferase